LFATENASRGWAGIPGAMKDPADQMFATTVANVPRVHGIEPSRDRRRTRSWSTCLKFPWSEVIKSCLSTEEVRTHNGLVTHPMAAVRTSRRVVCPSLKPHESPVM